jgi:signal transduction histidine kinase
MQMLVRNLLDNALRHQTGDAPVQLSTHAERDRALLVVRDHGPGVPPEDLQRLAQPFYRPDAARSRGSGGVGLGLYLCRLVAQSHGGTLLMRNADPGLEVTVALPRR